MKTQTERDNQSKSAALAGENSLSATPGDLQARRPPPFRVSASPEITPVPSLRTKSNIEQTEDSPEQEAGKSVEKTLVADDDDNGNSNTQPTLSASALSGEEANPQIIQRQDISPDGQNAIRRTRSRGLAGDLDSDWAGRFILQHYLYGAGVSLRFNNDPAWTRYMMANHYLRAQVFRQLRTIMQEHPPGTSPLHFVIDHHFHAEMENGEGIIGYQYLHGTNETVGDFQIRGTGIATPDGSGGYRVDFNLTFTWHDVIDPNPTYDTDTMKDAIAGVLSGGFREAYNIHISWTSTPSYTLDSSRQVVSTTGGYPRAIW